MVLTDPADTNFTHTVADRVWMSLALTLAKQAAAHDEVPVGAVVVCHGQLMGMGANACIANHDPTAHAEIIAIRSAAAHCGNYRLIDAVLYTSLEPCAMCAAAMVNARIKTVHFAASDPKSGACGSALDLCHHPKLNHCLSTIYGCEADTSRKLLQDFFKARRLSKSSAKSRKMVGRIQDPRMCDDRALFR